MFTIIGRRLGAMGTSAVFGFNTKNQITIKGLNLSNLVKISKDPRIDSKFIFKVVLKVEIFALLLEMIIKNKLAIIYCFRETWTLQNALNGSFSRLRTDKQGKLPSIFLTLLKITLFFKVGWRFVLPVNLVAINGSEGVLTSDTGWLISQFTQKIRKSATGHWASLIITLVPLILSTSPTAILTLIPIWRIFFSIEPKLVPTWNVETSQSPLEVL